MSATAHKLARVVYHVMRYGEACAAQQEQQFADEVRERQEKQLHRRARELGYDLVPKPNPNLAANPDESGSAATTELSH